MNQPTLQVPSSLLLAPNLSALDKLLWVVLSIEPAESQRSVSALSERSKLSRPSVRKALAHLAACGWTEPDAVGRPIPVIPEGSPDGWVSIPPELLLDIRLDTQARLLYGHLQLAPGFIHPDGRTRYADLAPSLGVTAQTAKQAMKALQQFGWVEATQKNQCAPIGFTLLNPAEAKRQAEADEVHLRVVEEHWEGQALMREFLTLLVDSDIYEDDASPDFLRNPYTDELLQFDRYYPPAVAFEFQGPQHDGPTERFPSKETAWKQRARDLIKVGICATKQIHLCHVRAADLSLEGMRNKVGALLPLRDLTGRDHIIDLLELMAQSQRRPHRTPASQAERGSRKAKTAVTGDGPASSADREIRPPAPRAPRARPG